MQHFGALPTALLAALLLSILSSATSISAPDEFSQGVQLDVINEVDCTRPTQNGDKIKVNYRGTLLSTGEEFDNSYDRGKPFEFTLGAHQVITGWDIALLGMCPDAAWRLTIPPELGYGNRRVGPIPAGSTLIFETVLLEIVGVKQPDVSSSASATATPTPSLAEATDEVITIATAPATPPTFGDQLVDIVAASEDGPLHAQVAEKRCQLLGPFALLVQGALGAFAMLTLVWKRYRETPQRPWKIWFFDVSKQVFGSLLTHVLNIGMSVFSTIQLANHAETFGAAAQALDADGQGPNPCSFYLLNLAIDTTLGIPILYVMLIIFHALCLRTPLARPPQSLKSGNYGEPPRTTWYLKQLVIYFLGLTGMKFCVFILFSVLPWLPWVGDWALRWTQGNEKLEIAFALFIFPLIMNAIQYYIIDNLIMDKKKDKGMYHPVHDEEAADEDDPLVGDEESHEDASEPFKLDDDDDDEEDDSVKTGAHEQIGSYSSSSMSKSDDGHKKSK